MREIDRKLIEAIESERPLEEIKKLIDESADVNIEIPLKKYEKYLLEIVPTSNFYGGHLKQKYISIIDLCLIIYFMYEYEIMAEKHTLSQLNLQLNLPLEYRDSNLEKEISESYKNIEKYNYKMNEIKKTILFILEQNFDIKKFPYLIFPFIDTMDKDLVYKIFNEINCDITINNNLNVMLYAISIGAKNFVKKLIESGKCDINYRDNSGVNILFYAIDKGDLDFVKYLVEKNVDIYVITKNGISALLFSFLENKKEIFDFLKSKYNQSELVKLSEELEYLLCSKIIEKVKNKKIKKVNFKILFKPSWERNKKNITYKEIIERAKKYKIMLNLDKHCHNKRLIDLAIQNMDLEMLKFLIKEGADVNLTLKNGQSLLEFAQNIENEKLINLIKSSPTYKPLDHNPKKLVEILTNFRKDSPIKYTTHLWDFDFKKEYKNFQNYIKAVKNQWNGIEKELKNLSSNIHRKIELFLFAKNQDEVWSSAKGDKLAIGCSNLEGLEKWCNAGKNPFDFELPKTYRVEGKTLSTFGDVVNVFKREIQIRNENNHLEEIISEFEEIIYEKDDNFEIEYKKLKGKTFYTDVEVFKKTLDKIFSEMLKRKDYPKILIEAKNDNEKYFDLYITQIGSFSNLSAEEMLEKVKGGDFADIKNNLKNLCDWNVENRDANNQSYRVNYLISRPVDRIEKIKNDIQGFTHILRFYK